MRGWKVQLEPDLSQAQVGKSRGPSLKIRGTGWARSQRSDLCCWLVEDFPEGWTDEHESALCEHLSSWVAGHWLLVAEGALRPNWNELTAQEQALLRLREGFLPLSSWSPPAPALASSLESA